jgi:hypothetical protein
MTARIPQVIQWLSMAFNGFQWLSQWLSQQPMHTKFGLTTTLGE